LTRGKRLLYIGEIMSGVQHTRIDTEKNLLDVLDRVHEISEQNIDTTHVFPLSQVFEGLLLKMGKKTPFTLDKFGDFFQLLQEAKRQAEPLREKARPLTIEAMELRAQVKELKRQNTTNAKEKIDELSTIAAKLETEARELTNEKSFSVMRV
jgi:hypothetical protein